MRSVVYMQIGYTCEMDVEVHLLMAGMAVRMCAITAFANPPADNCRTFPSDHARQNFPG